MKNYFSLSICFSLFLLLAMNPGTCFGNNILVTITTDKTNYSSHEAIAIALTVLNQDAASRQVTFTSGRTHDFYLYNSQHQLIWKWSGGKMFTQALSTLNLEPKKPLTYVTILDPEKLNLKLQPGQYQLTGALCPKGHEYLSEPITLEIR